MVLYQSDFRRCCEPIVERPTKWDLSFSLKEIPESLSDQTSSSLSLPRTVEELGILFEKPPFLWMTYLLTFPPSTQSAVENVYNQKENKCEEGNTEISMGDPFLPPSL